MNPAPGIVGFAYAAMAQGRLDHLKAMMDAVINAELVFMVPILRALVIMYVGMQFFLFMYGLLTVERLITSCIRPLVVVFLIMHSGAFAQWVRDPIFTKIPAAISSTILASVGVDATSSMGPARQFDQVALKMDAITARTLELNTSWSATSIGNSLAAQIANMAAQTLLGMIAGVWMCGTTLLAILLCFGPILLVFELFDRTRHLVESWITKCVGILAFGMGTSILLALQMQEMTDLLNGIHGAMGSNVSEAVGMLVHVCANMVLDLLTMIALPAAVGFGSAAAASLAGPATMLALRGAPGIAGAAGQIGKAAASRR